MTSTLSPPATGDSPGWPWCGACDLPTEMCHCAATADRSTPAGESRVTGRPVDGSRTTGRPVDTLPVGDRSPVDRGDTARSGTGRFDGDGRSPTGRSGGKPAPIRLGTGGWTTVVVLAVFGLALGVVGFAVSFATVEAAMRPAFGGMAWLVPLGVDLGIIVFSGIGLLLAKLDMRIRWLRIVPWALTAATIYLNVTAHDGLVFQVAHAVLPMLWVVVSEVVAHIVGLRVGLERGTVTDSIPLMRWILAPIATTRLWRLMRLWDIRSYEAVLADERRRLLARTALATKYGWKWRWTAPAMLRAKYKLRDLSDVEVWAWQGTGRSDRTPTGDTKTHRPAATGNDRHDTKPTGGTRSKATGRPARKPQRPNPTGASDRNRVPATGVDETPTGDRLAAAFAEFQATGVMPSGAQLAEKAGCSKSVANDWKRTIRKGDK